MLFDPFGHLAMVQEPFASHVIVGERMMQRTLTAEPIGLRNSDAFHPTPAANLESL